MELAGVSLSVSVVVNSTFNEREKMPDQRNAILKPANNTVLYKAKRILHQHKVTQRT